MSTWAELYIDIGSDFQSNVYSNMNLVGYTVSSSVRKSYYSLNVTANFICTITSAVNGNVNLSLPASNSLFITIGTYPYDVKAINANINSTIRIQEGFITFTGMVTGFPSQFGVP